MYIFLKYSLNAIAELLSPQIPLKSPAPALAGQNLFKQPKANLHSYGDRGFAVAAPHCDPIWNALPADLRACATYDSFKKHLKTYLFKSAFPEL